LVTYIAERTQEPLLSIIEGLKQIFVYNEAESPLQMLEHLATATQEGTDFSIEKVFETPHPYPNREYVQKEQISIHKAIGYTVEVDRRSCTQYNSDCLIMMSADHAFWVNDSFGTHIRLYQQSYHKVPLMILGSKLSIEFRSYPHNQKKGPPGGYRGGFGGGRGGAHGGGRSREDDSA